MRVIIAGSRTITDYNVVRKAIFLALWNWRKGYSDVTEVISGGAKGVDKLGEQWAIKNNKTYHIFPAFWEEQGKRAGYLRNCGMAEYVGKKQSGEIGGLIAIWDGKSKGTKMMIDIAKKEGLKIYVYKI